MTHLPPTLQARIEEESEKLYPCEPPCDSYGICGFCNDARMYRSGARALFDILSPEIDKLVGALDRVWKEGGLDEYAFKEADKALQSWAQFTGEGK